MRWGSGAADASWLTLLPGCLLAGLGLGVINTPVTNTTTGSVSASRAGMASGIDMSARLITLAVNIALMGFLLLAGIADALRRALPELAVSLPALAERIAAGHLATLHREFPALAALDPSGTIAHAALLRGFGGVMLYGALGVWMLAALSALAFHGGSRRPAVACASRQRGLLGIAAVLGQLREREQLVQGGEEVFRTVVAMGREWLDPAWSGLPHVKHPLDLSPGEWREPPARAGSFTPQGKHLFFAAKHFDPQLGIDAHTYLAPPGVWPTVHIGIVMDPFDYLPTIQVSPDNPIVKGLGALGTATEAAKNAIGEGTA
eukprot:gene32056-36188_t